MISFRNTWMKALTGLIILTIISYAMFFLFTTTTPKIPQTLHKPPLTKPDEKPGMKQPEPPKPTPQPIRQTNYFHLSSKKRTTGKCVNTQKVQNTICKFENVCLRGNQWILTDDEQSKIPLKKHLASTNSRHYPWQIDLSEKWTMSPLSDPKSIMIEDASVGGQYCCDNPGHCIQETDLPMHINQILFTKNSMFPDPSVFERKKFAMQGAYCIPGQDYVKSAKLCKKLFEAHLSTMSRIKPEQSIIIVSENTKTYCFKKLTVGAGFYPYQLNNIYQHGLFWKTHRDYSFMSLGIIPTPAPPKVIRVFVHFKQGIRTIAKQNETWKMMNKFSEYQGYKIVYDHFDYTGNFRDQIKKMSVTDIWISSGGGGLFGGLWLPKGAVIVPFPLCNYYPQPQAPGMSNIWCSFFETAQSLTALPDVGVLPLLVTEADIFKNTRTFHEWQNFDILLRKDIFENHMKKAIALHLTLREHNKL